MDFAHWLTLVEAQTDFPGNLPLPPRMTESVVSWFFDGFLKAVHINIGPQLRAARDKHRQAQRDLNRPPDVDLDKIRFDVSWDRYHDPDDSVGSRDDEINRRAEKARQKPKEDYSFARYDYGNYLDLERHLKGMGLRKDFDFAEHYMSGRPLVKEFPFELGEFSTMIAKVRKKNPRLELRQPPPLVCVMTRDTNNRFLNYGAARGQFRIFDNSLAVSLDDAEHVHSVQDLEERSEIFISTVKHEFMHAVWRNIYVPLGITRDDPHGEFGTPGWDYEPYDDEKTNQLYYASRTEYPTQLLSALADFRRTVALNMKQDRNYRVTPDVIRAFTGEIDDGWKYLIQPHRLFASLKRHRPDVWRQAAKNFYKAYMRDPVVPQRVNAGQSSFVPVARTAQYKGKFRNPMSYDAALPGEDEYRDDD